MINKIAVNFKVKIKQCLKMPIFCTAETISEIQYATNSQAVGSKQSDR